MADPEDQVEKLPSAFDPLDETRFFEQGQNGASATVYASSISASQAAASAPGIGPCPSEGLPATLPGSSAASQPSLEITVTDPVKQGSGVQAYVSYRVSTKTSMPQYRWAQFSVIRRFSDFAVLHARLGDKHKGAIVPPLPEKNAVGQLIINDRFSADFIEMRKRALDAFINRVARHPLLRNSSDLQLFLEASEEDWASEVARSQEGLLKKPPHLMQLFKDVKTSVKNAVMGSDKGAVETDKDMEMLKSYATLLESYMAEARKRASLIVRRQQEFSKALSEFSESMIELGRCQGEPLARPLAELGQRSDILATIAAKQSQDLALTLELPLREYVRMVLAVKAALADRAQAFHHQQEMEAELEGKKARLARAEAGKVLAELKRAEMEKGIAEMKRAIEVAKEEYQMIVERMQKEVARFQEEKAQDFARVLEDFASLQVKVANEAATLWKSLKPVIEGAKLPTPGPSIGAGVG